MVKWASVVVSLMAVMLCFPAARADETTKKIQAALKKVEGSVVAVRYSRDLGDMGGDIRMGRGRGFARAFGGPRITSGIVTNEEGFVAIPADVTRDPTRGWMGREGRSSTPRLKDLTVILAGGEERKARLAGRDSGKNLAFVQVENRAGLKPVDLASKSGVDLAEQVIVVAPLSDREPGTQRFLLTRINAVVEGDAPYYSVMDDLGPYDGGIVANLKGEVIGMVGRPPAPQTEGEDEEEDMLRAARRFMGGRAQGLAVVPCAGLEQIFAKPPTGLLALEEEEEEEEEGEGEKKDEGEGEKKPEKKPDEDY